MTKLDTHESSVSAPSRIIAPMAVFLRLLFGIITGLLSKMRGIPRSPRKPVKRSIKNISGEKLRRSIAIYRYYTSDILPACEFSQYSPGHGWKTFNQESDSHRRATGRAAPGRRTLTGATGPGCRH